MSLKARLFASLTLILLSFLGLGTYALNRLNAVQQAAEVMGQNRLPSIMQIADASEASLRYRQQILRHSIQTSAAAMLEAEQLLEREGAEVEEFFTSYKARISDPAERALYDEARRGWDEYVRESRRVMELSRQGQQAVALELINTTNRKSFQDFESARQQLRAFNFDRAEEAAKKSRSTYETTFWLVLGVMVLGTLFIAALALGLVQGIGRPILRLTGAMERMTAGDLDTIVADQQRRDEIGTMARALEVFRAKVRDSERLAAAQAAQDRASRERGERLEELVRRFGAETGHALDRLQQAAKRLDGTSGEMSRSAEESARLTGTLSRVTQDASGNAQTAAAATEQLTASIGEITRQVGRSAEVSRRAVEETERTDRTVRELAETASRIGDVVRLIADIAGQTNLLALNATIEAARAGEAGKGFAVVASEVKSLASQTAKATEEIGQQVGAIQGATSLAVEAIRSIAAVVAEIDQTAAAIAAAVEEQGAATQEIARNIAGTAEAAAAVSRETGVVRGAADVSGRAAEELHAASTEVSDASSTLRGQMERFLHSVRAA